MNLRQLWSIIRGRRTNFRWLNASWTYSPPLVRLPWGINTIGSLYHPDVQAGLPDGRYVAAVCEPCPPSIRERFRAAWWVFTGRAYAFVWPKAGDLEAVWTRDNPTLRPSPRPFVPSGTRAVTSHQSPTEAR